MTSFLSATNGAVFADVLPFEKQQLKLLLKALKNTFFIYPGKAFVRLNKEYIWDALPRGGVTIDISKT